MTFEIVYVPSDTPVAETANLRTVPPRIDRNVTAPFCVLGAAVLPAQGVSSKSQDEKAMSSALRYP